MPQPTFSIVIPCYNAETTIRNTIMSCIELHMPPLEIIVVDDASSDDSANIVREITETHNQLSLIELEENNGVSHARNTGWAAATGDYILFLDSDDTFHPEKTAVLDTYIRTYGSAFYWHPFVYHADHPEYIPIRQKPGAITTSFWSLIISNRISTCCFVVPRNWPLRFDEGMRYCEDHDFVLRSAYLRPLVKIPLPLTHIHRKINSAGGLSGHIWSMRKGEIRMYNKLYRLNIGFILVQPILTVFSLCKHLFLLVRKRA